MAIKRRKSVPDANYVAPVKKLEIVAKPKKPIPPRGMLSGLYGPEPSPTIVRYLAVTAAACGALADDGFEIEDRVTAIRSVYDETNPQEARYRNRVRNRGTAITAMCMVCVGGRKAVTECANTQCSLWAFRFGSDPFWGKDKK